MINIIIGALAQNYVLDATPRICFVETRFAYMVIIEAPNA
jgi:hypothetical protein